MEAVERMLAWLCLGLVFGSAKGAPSSPCPGVFEYRLIGPGQWSGHIVATAPAPGEPLTVVAKLNVKAILQPNQVGHLHLWYDKNLISRKINAEQIKTIDYELLFPVQKPLPDIDQIVVNNVIVCQGPAVTARAVTKVNLEHTLVSRSTRPLSGQPIAYPDPYQEPPPFDSSIFDEAEAEDERIWQVNQPPLPYRTTKTPSKTTTRRTMKPTPSTPAPVASRLGDVTNEDRDAVCGYPVITRPLIVRGSPTERGAWPWLAAIYKEEKMAFLCGGSLINMKHVITAGHCIKDRYGTTKEPEELVIVLGKYDLTRWAEPKNQPREIASIHLHPNYDYLTMSDDVAVLVLDTPVEYTPFVRPICLWDTDISLDLIVGQTGTVVGWGRDEHQETVTDKPQMVTVPIVSQETCLRSRPEFQSFTSERTLCAGYRNGTGPCSGDSGGGLMMPVDQGGGIMRWFLRGIVSLSLNDKVNMTCDLQEFVIYTDIAKYLPWLQQFTR